MRFLCAAVLCVTTGCASTVSRLDGEFPTSMGPARSDCEKADWLVVAPTRAEFVTDHGRRAEKRDDGVALYRVGARRPESIPSLADDMGTYSPTFERHSSAVRGYDNKQYIAASLGAAGIIAIGIGTALFISAFETKTSRNASGAPQEEHSVNGAAAAIGGGLVGIGFGLGIGGIAVNPGQAERSRAESARYVFLPPEDKREDVVNMTAKYNQMIRERCRTEPAR